MAVAQGGVGHGEIFPTRGRRKQEVVTTHHVLGPHASKSPLWLCMGLYGRLPVRSYDMGDKCRSGIPSNHDFLLCWPRVTAYEDLVRTCRTYLF